MKHRIRSIFAAFLTGALLLTAILPTAALTPSYTVQAPYLTSPYYEALVAYTLTGDMRQDVLAIAFTQIGYHEGDSENDMDGLNVFGSKNFVEYNRLYGKLDNGEGNGRSYGYAWCAAFVSWCLRQAGVPEALAVTEVSCNRMTNWFTANSAYHPLSRGYTPLPGDIIMFHNGDNSADHVGLVVGVKDGDVYTIEGNSGGVVGQHMYRLDDKGILGYCVPAYTVKAGAAYDFPLDADASQPGEYIVTASSLNVRAGAGASHAKLGVLSLGDTVKITWCDGAWGRIDYAGKEGWISMSYVASTANLVYTVKYNVGDGKNAPTSQRKKPGESITITDTIPEQRNYTFGGWATELPAKTAAYRAGDVYSTDENLTLHAIWEPVIYKLTLKLDDGTVWQTVEIPFGEKVNLGNLLPTKATDSENHYTFAGWNEKLPQYLRGDDERTAIFAATPLTDKEKAALVAAEAETQAETGGTPIIVPVAIVAALLAIAAPVVLAGFRLRKKKLAVLDAAMAESTVDDNTAEDEKARETEESTH